MSSFFSRWRQTSNRKGNLMMKLKGGGDPVLSALVGRAKKIECLKMSSNDRT